MSDPLKILVIEDSEADFLLLRNHLGHQGVAAECRRVSTPGAAWDALAEGGWDVVLSDYNVPGLDVQEVIDGIRNRHPDLPVILISGSIGEENAVQLLRRGVCDFILKGNLSRLAPAIHRSRQDVAERRARRQAETALRASRVAALNMMEDAVEARRQAERTNLDLQQEIAERRRAGEALERSEAEFRAIFQLASIGMAQTDPRTGRFVRVNQKMCAITGYSEEELLARCVPDITHPEDRQADMGLYHGVVRGEAPDYRSEKRYVRKDGSTAWVSVNMTVIRDAAGAPLRTMAAIEDIQDRKRAEQERELTVRLLGLLNASGDLRELMREVTLLLRESLDCEAVGIRLRNGDDFPYFETRGFPPEFVQAENELCRVDACGKPARDADGNPVFDCMCGNVLSGRFDPSKPFFTGRGSFWSNDTTRLLATTTEADRQSSTRNRCNGEGYESVALIALRAGGTTFGLLQFNDRRKDRFTPEGMALIERLADSIAIGIAHRRGQELLQRSEERYRRLFEGLSDPVYVLRLAAGDTPGGFVEVNGAVCRQLGYTRDEMMRKTPFDIDPHLTADLGRQLVDQVLRDNGAVFTTTHCAKDGRHIPVEISAHTFEFGGEALVLCIARDLTERRRLEAQVRQAQKMEAIGQLAGGVAHDFNNILTTTQLQVELMQDNPSLDAETQEGLRELMAQARRAAGLTRQLLLFSRQSAIQLAPLDLNEVAGNLLKMLRRVLGEDIDVRLHGKTSLPRVKADVGMIEQVLMNLTVNARDAMPQGGHLTIATETAMVDEARTREHPEAHPGPFVCLVVTDTGCGMDEATLQRIFEPFFTTKEVGKGTGLGLATVYGIVKQHGGWVEVSSRLGEGTEFRVFLPALQGDIDAAAAEPEAPPPPGGDETILLVEDDADVRRVTAAYLRARGYRVLEAGTGREAIALWTRHSDEIGLVYSDMVMPEGMTGLDLVRHLREARPGLRVILSSGYSAELARPGDLKARHIDFVPKPTPPSEMALAVRRCLDSPAPPGLSR